MSSMRGGYAPRGHRGGRNTPFYKQKKEPVKPDIKRNPLGEHLRTLRNADLEVEATKLATVDTAISDLRYVASYNWRNDDSTAILVPGRPPQWTPLKDAPRLKEDSGQYYRDVNAAKYPTFPIAPVVQSVLDLDPTFSTTATDVVACGSTLGNLLRFVRRQDKPFRFTVETIGNTVFFVRKENDPKEVIPDVRGYGHSFPEANTTWNRDVSNSATHQRIVQYEFGGLTCLVRFECDGYIKKGHSSVEPSARSAGIPKQDDDDTLLSAFNKAAITQHPLAPKVDTEGIQIIRSGSEVPQDSIFDLKTRSGKYRKEIDLSDIHPQLWIKQIPNFIVAYHDGAGLFQDVRVRDVREEVQNWERDNADAIRRLAVLLEKVISFARTEGGLLEVYSPGVDCLELHKQYGEGVHVLPEGLRAQWAAGIEEDHELSVSGDEYGGFTFSRQYVVGKGWDNDLDEDEPDYTACSAEDCGYCGKCTY